MIDNLEIPFISEKSELKVSLQAALDAGKAIMNIYNEDFTSETKSDNSPITKADIKSNEIIKSLLSKTSHKILSEEDKDDKTRLDEDIIWVVDPLDGTSDFIGKTGEFTVMIALVKNKKPVLGIIYWPVEESIFLAQKGKGAFRFANGEWEKIQVSEIENLNKVNAVGSRNHLSDEEKNLIEKLQIPKFTTVGSSLKVCKISSGEADMYFTTTNKMKEWDTCASNCIITEAGGKMTDISGNEITYNNEITNHQNGILATNGLIHEKIVEEFKKFQ